MDDISQKLYDAIEIFKNYRFPFLSNEPSMEKFLDKIFTTYNTQLQRFDFLQKEDKEAIQTLCSAIVESIKLYNDFDIIKSYSVLFSSMDVIKDQLWWCFLENNPHGYYRIRKGTKENIYSALEMLHIPFKYRHLADTARFSLPGIPSTYMASMKSVAWYESGMPSQFCLAGFAVNCNEYQKHKVLKLDINPLITSHQLQLMLLNNKSFKEVLPLYISMAKMYPILFACSITVKNKAYPFKQEYIIPQMLMSWVKQSTEFVGIRYNTASGYERAAEYNAFNLVIPTKEIDADGYCSLLKKLFLSDDTVTKFIDVQDYFKKSDIHIISMRDMYGKAKFDYQICKVELPYRDLLGIIQCISQNYDLLCNQYNSCAITAIDTISTLDRYNKLHIKNLQEKYGNDFSDFTAEGHTQHFMTDEIRKDVQKTLSNYQKITTEFFDSFVNIDFKIFIG